jgi:transposase
MLGGRNVQAVYELHGQGRSIRAIAQGLGISRNSVRKYLRASEIPKPQPRPQRPSKLDAYREQVHQRLREGVDNCVVLLRELRAQGYTGSYTILKDYVQPLRRRRTPIATVRFETRPGEQAQVDFGLFRYRTPEGKLRSVWAFVLVLSWSRAVYVEFIGRANLATFLRCHLNAFERLGGIPQQCLYDNTKLVVLGREAGEPLWTPRFLDFARRLGFRPALCHPYRPQTKGRVESGVKYLRGNFWPTERFTDDADLNRHAQAWCEGVAQARIHGTTRARPADLLLQERLHLQPLAAWERLAPFLREERQVGRDGYVSWEGAWYGVPWQWAGQRVEVQADATVVALWMGEQRLALHPRATQRGQRFTAPGQWVGLQRGDQRPPLIALAQQLPTIEVEQRSLGVYDALVSVGGNT